MSAKTAYSLNLYLWLISVINTIIIKHFSQRSFMHEAMPSTMRESPCPLDAESPSNPGDAKPILPPDLITPVGSPKTVGNGKGWSVHQRLHLAEAFWVTFLHSQNQECPSHIP